MKDGFSIVEATLAVVVVAAGVLSIFLLFSAGLDLGTPAVQDTTCAMFADSVLNGLRAQSEQAAEEGYAGLTGHSGWIAFWEDFGDGLRGMPVPAHCRIVGGDTNTLIEAGALCTNLIVYNPLRSTADLSSIYDAVRYRITVEWETQTTNVVATELLTNRTAVTLKVWPGEAGSTNDTDALILYTQFRYNGNL